MSENIGFEDLIQEVELRRDMHDAEANILAEDLAVESDRMEEIQATPEFAIVATARAVRDLVLVAKKYASINRWMNRGISTLFVKGLDTEPTYTPTRSLTTPTLRAEDIVRPDGLVRVGWRVGLTEEDRYGSTTPNLDQYDPNPGVDIFQVAMNPANIRHNATPLRWAHIETSASDTPVRIRREATDEGTEDLLDFTHGLLTEARDMLSSRRMARLVAKEQKPRKHYKLPQ